MEIDKPRRVVVLGSTGSIGKAVLDVIQTVPGFELFGITAYSDRATLGQQVEAFSPRYAVLAGMSEEVAPANFSHSKRTHIRFGESSLVELASHPEVDIVVAAIVGSAGLPACLAATEHGKRLALANKEALVVAGENLIDSAQKNGAEIVPIDSEHCAIFQALRAGNTNEAERLILTASGGPLRDWPIDRLSNASVQDTLSHPTWNMGKKITVDSATMMNKALEVIEARWLFDLPSDRISVVIHPQSIIHSMVEFVDGSVVAQLGPPDMRLPIQYALTYPNRCQGPARRMDWTQATKLEWFPVDFDRYPCLNLGYEVMQKAGSTGAVLNAANEIAVERYLSQQCRFTDIFAICRSVLDHHNFESSPSLARLLELDRWAREEARRWR